MDFFSYHRYFADIRKAVKTTDTVRALLDKYGDAQAIVGMISQVVSSASDFIGNFVTPTKVTKVIKDVTK